VAKVTALGVQVVNHQETVVQAVAVGMQIVTAAAIAKKI
jgi:hypothetical protein